MSKEELKEFQADGENSSIADPVVGAGGNVKSRRADKFTSANPTAEKVDDLEGQNKGEKLIGGQKSMSQAPARKADKRTVKEYVEEIFDGHDLTEEFKEKIEAILEGSINDRVAGIREELEEEFASKLEEHVESFEEKMGEYMDYIIEQWLEENEVAIESTTKVAVAESFMEGLKELFVEHNVVLPEEGVNVLEDLENRIAELEEQLNEAVSDNIELTNLIKESQEDEIFDELAEGLTETQKDKLRTLSENIEYTDIDQYKAKVSTIKESFLNKKTEAAEEALNEEFNGDSAKVEVVDPQMSAYLNAVSRTQRK